MAKEGTVVSGLCDAFATAISLALQYGVPLRVLVDKFVNTRFEPQGFTHHPQIHYAKSIMDYIFRWLALKFLPDNGTAAAAADDAARSPGSKEAGAELGSTQPPMNGQPGREADEPRPYSAEADAPVCADCGSFMTPNGSCYICTNCGSSSGCS
jgi:ribonucleoside-diphosphate reductase alpha chain